MAEAECVITTLSSSRSRSWIAIEAAARSRPCRIDWPSSETSCRSWSGSRNVWAFAEARTRPAAPAIAPTPGLLSASCRPASISASNSSAEVSNGCSATSSSVSTVRRAIQLAPCSRSAVSSSTTAARPAMQGVYPPEVRFPTWPRSARRRSGAPHALDPDAPCAVDLGRDSRLQRGAAAARALLADGRDARRSGAHVRADLRRRRVDRRHVCRARTAPRRGRARAGGSPQAELRPARGDARRPRALARRDLGDDGRRPPERAGGPAAADRGSGGRRRRRERDADRAARFLGADASVARDQRDASSLHGRRHLGLRLRVQCVPAKRDRADARGDRQAEVHEGARAVGRRERCGGRCLACAAGGPVPLLALAADAAGAARARRLLAPADPVDRDRARCPVHDGCPRARDLRRRVLDRTSRTSPDRCSAAWA